MALNGRSVVLLHSKHKPYDFILPTSSAHLMGFNANPSMAFAKIARAASKSMNLWMSQARPNGLPTRRLLPIRGMVLRVVAITPMICMPNMRRDNSDVVPVCRSGAMSSSPHSCNAHHRLNYS
jgi:hypothetical protein